MKQDTVAAALNEARKFSALAQSVLSAAKDDKFILFIFWDEVDGGNAPAELGVDAVARGDEETVNA